MHTQKRKKWENEEERKKAKGKLKEMYKTVEKWIGKEKLLTFSNIATLNYMIIKETTWFGWDPLSTVCPLSSNA